MSDKGDVCPIGTEGQVGHPPLFAQGGKSLRVLGSPIVPYVDTTCTVLFWSLRCRIERHPVHTESERDSSPLGDLTSHGTSRDGPIRHRTSHLPLPDVRDRKGPGGDRRVEKEETVGVKEGIWVTLSSRVGIPGVLCLYGVDSVCYRSYRPPGQSRWSCRILHAGESIRPTGITGSRPRPTRTLEFYRL